MATCDAAVTKQGILRRCSERAVIRLRGGRWVCRPHERSEQYRRPLEHLVRCTAVGCTRRQKPSTAAKHGGLCPQHNAARLRAIRAEWGPGVA